MTQIRLFLDGNPKHIEESVNKFIGNISMIDIKDIKLVNSENYYIIMVIYE